MGTENKQERLDKLKKKIKKQKQTSLENQEEAFSQEDDVRFMDQMIAPKFKNKDKDGVDHKKKKSKDNGENEIDERFAHMFTDSNFRSVSKVDRYGGKVDPNTGTDLDKFYDKKDIEKSRADKKKKNDKKLKKKQKDFNEEKFNWSEESSEEDNDIKDEKELKRLLGEDDHSINTDEEDELWDKEKNAPTFEGSSTKLALMNYDWNFIGADEIFVLFSSFLPTDGYIKKVTVYPSQFGKEMMEREELEGPKAIWEHISKTENLNLTDKKIDEIVKTKSKKPNSYMGEDWTASNNIEDENSLNVNLVRKYELTKQRYFYSVIELDSERAANYIYKHCDGSEFMRSGLTIDLRFIPEDLEFPYKPAKICKTMPTKKQTAIENFISRADSHTQVNFTWEAPDNSRYQHLYKMDDAELDEANLDEYMASSSDDQENPDDDIEEDEFFNEKPVKQGKNKKREGLLANLDKSKGAYGDFKKKTNNDFTIVFKGGLDAGFGRKANDSLVDEPKVKKSKNKLKKNNDEVQGKREKEEIEIIADKDDLKVVSFLLIKLLGIQSGFEG